VLINNKFDGCVHCLGGEHTFNFKNMETKESFEELRDKITEDGKQAIKVLINGYYGSIRSFKYESLWKDLDDWAIKNKYPSWRKQKNYIISISTEHGISMHVTKWKKIFKIYDELYKKSYFLRWDIDCIPWLENKIDTYSKSEII